MIILWNKYKNKAFRAFAAGFGRARNVITSQVLPTAKAEIIRLQSGINRIVALQSGMNKNILLESTLTRTVSLKSAITDSISLQSGITRTISLETQLKTEVV